MACGLTGNYQHLEEIHCLHAALVFYPEGSKRYSSPVTGLEWPRGFQEVKVPRFHDNGTGWW